MSNPGRFRDFVAGFTELVATTTDEPTLFAQGGAGGNTSCTATRSSVFRW